MKKIFLIVVSLMLSVGAYAQISDGGSTQYLYKVDTGIYSDNQDVAVAWPAKTITVTASKGTLPSADKGEIAIDFGFDSNGKLLTADAYSNSDIHIDNSEPAVSPAGYYQVEWCTSYNFIYGCEKLNIAYVKTPTL